MKCSPPLHNNGRLAWLVGALVATASLSAARADGPRRLPGTTAEQGEQVDSSRLQPAASAEGLFQSFKQRKSEADASSRSAMLASQIDRNRKQSSQPNRWLRSSTSGASNEVARRLILQASREYDAGAWASAESSAWEALRWAAESVETASRENTEARPKSRPLPALANLLIARTAIREARDFSGHYGVVNSDAIRRMAMSHRTKVIDLQQPSNLSASDVIDRYLDEARVRLSATAARSVEAAQAMDLLAAVYLGRADANTLPSSTALCLRRAALQGQPNNASLALRLGMHLADLGLYQEAQWALQRSMRLQPSPQASDALIAVLRRSGKDQEAAHWIAVMGEQPLASQQTPRPRVPEVTELSPQEFAAISKSLINPIPTNPTSATENTTIGERWPPTQNRGTRGTLASAKQKPAGGVSATSDRDGQSQSGEDQAMESEKPSFLRRIFRPFKGVW